MRPIVIKSPALLLVLTSLFAASPPSADYNLAKLANSGDLDFVNRSPDQSKAGDPKSVFLNSADDYGLAWISGVDFSNGVIELELKGENNPGKSFVGIAFHGRNNKTFDAVYLRPFNFQASAAHRNHSIQYISLPDHDWSELREKSPGKHEAGLTPAPSPTAWMKLKLVLKGNNLSAFVNAATKPALSIELLGDRDTGKVGLWVGNDSSGWFRNLQITSAAR